MPLNKLSTHLKLFLDILASGSFSAAASQHDLTPSAVARRINALEKELDCQLFNRTTHAVRPTPAGRAFALQARSLLEQLQQARAELESEQQASGLIRLDAPAPFGRYHLAPLIAEFLDLHPGVDIELHLTESFVDRHGSRLDNMDLAIRIGSPADTRLIATPLAPMRRIVCASPQYLEGNSRPISPADLADYHGLDWSQRAPEQAWQFSQQGRIERFRPQRIRLQSNHAEALLSGALAGLGLAHLPTWLVSEYLCCGELVPLFCENGLPEPETGGIHILRLSRQLQTRTRLLVEFLQARLSPTPPWDRALQELLGKRD